MYESKRQHSYRGSSPLHYIWSSKRYRTALLSITATLLIYTFYCSFAINTDVLSWQDYASSGIDWSKYAYVQYAMDRNYLCNSILHFETLQRLGSRPDRVLMFPKAWDPDLGLESQEAKMLAKVKAEYSVRLKPVEKVKRGSHMDEDTTWSDSFTKLLAFNLTEYSRVLSFDSDSTILQSMDELFLLPLPQGSAVAMPRAYWLHDSSKPGEDVLGSHFILADLTRTNFAEVQAAVEAAGEEEFDMEVINRLFAETATLLPHRKYSLLTGEFRSQDHQNYFIGEDSDIEESGQNEGPTWDPRKALATAKYVHFSDWPLPKPWRKIEEEEFEKYQPSCDGSDCAAREIWRSFYSDFKKRKWDICLTI